MFNILSGNCIVSFVWKEKNISYTRKRWNGTLVNIEFNLSASEDELASAIRWIGSDYQSYEDLFAD